MEPSAAPTPLETQYTVQAQDFPNKAATSTANSLLPFGSLVGLVAALEASLVASGVPAESVARLRQGSLVAICPTCRLQYTNTSIDALVVASTRSKIHYAPARSRTATSRLLDGVCGSSRCDSTCVQLFWCPDLDPIALGYLRRLGVLAPSYGQHRHKLWPAALVSVQPAAEAAPAPSQEGIAQPQAHRNLGGCRIDDIIGRGGSGTVYRAHHLALDIPVALKVLSSSAMAGDEAAAARLVREARTAARLIHPNIVRVLNLGEEHGIHFLVMELVSGGSLQALLDEQRKLPVAHAIDVIAQVCSGLHFAHENGVIHRDLKPDNLLIELDGTIKIADLGLAKRLGDFSNLTRSGVIMGTPHYMAPEQAASTAAVDRRCDIYSLGCTLYRMLAGKMPYDGEQLMQVLYLHVHAPIPDVRNVNPAVPEQLALLIRKMMAKAPEQRYSTAQHVFDALRLA